MNNLLTKFSFQVLPFLIAASLTGCSATSKTSNQLSMSYNSFARKIEIPTPTKEQKAKFNADIKSEKVDIKKPGGKVISGYKTANKEFLEEVVRPIVLPHLDELKKMPKEEMINTLALFGHELFQIYFGKDFYRWGGDILDLDDPQSEEFRHDAKYGLDCSGFSTLPYELAVYFGLLDKEDTEATASSKGFEVYCKKNNVEDKGGLDGEGNNFRVDTRELASLGREIIRIDEGGTPTDEQVSKLQAGDLVGRNGHFGIIVEINGELFYLESGGWVVPNTGGNPYHAKEALEIFAKHGIVMVRRVLADKKAI
ncbi:MAG: hypothetical protein Q8858_04415 [Bacteroidota bacterium]|nr:hypothetical protein [Bacteroidota bacterium]